MLGVPEGDRQHIRHWLDIGLHREAGQIHPTDEGREAMIAMGTYMWQMALDKRAHPGNDMISDLIACEVDDGTGATTTLDDVEIDVAFPERFFAP